MLIRWLAPVANGSPITSYFVYIRTKAGVFHLEETCEPDSNLVLNQQSCYVPLATLVSSPYNLQLLDSVYAKVTAQNYYGTTALSLSGNGALIFLVPDPPENLQLNPDFSRSETVVSFIWTKSAFNGGRGVIDFRVWSDGGVQGAEFSILATGVT